MVGRIWLSARLWHWVSREAAATRLNPVRSVSSMLPWNSSARDPPCRPNTAAAHIPAANQLQVSTSTTRMDNLTRHHLPSSRHKRGNDMEYEWVPEGRATRSEGSGHLFATQSRSNSSATLAKVSGRKPEVVPSPDLLVENNDSDTL